MSLLRRILFQRIRFNRRAFDRLATPRRPRHRALRLVVGLVGVGLLLALLFVSVFVGVAMLAAGMLLRLWKQRRAPIAAGRGGSIDGTFQVVGKPSLPFAR